MRRDNTDLSYTDKLRIVGFFQPQGKHEKPTLYGDTRYWKSRWPQENELDMALIVLLKHAQKGIQ